MTSFLHAYFTRLNCQPLTVPTVETLGTLHLAHNCAIPFENLEGEYMDFTIPPPCALAVDVLF